MNLDNLLIKPAPSFDEPIDMLRACHERIAAQCTTLEKLAAHLPVHGADTQAQQAARNIMRYFDVAGPHHHADEEQDLFPMLIKAARPQCSPMGERIASLLDEHRVLEAAWVQLRTVLADIAEAKQGCSNRSGWLSLSRLTAVILPWRRARFFHLLKCALIDSNWPR